MQRRFKTVSPSPGMRQQVSLCAAFIAVFTLAGSITAWALCPYGEIAQKQTGGGACLCSDKEMRGFTWYCAGYYYCTNGPKDYEKSAGGCIGPTNQSTACHSNHYQWTENSYDTVNCGVNYINGTLTGNCNAVNPQHPYADDGWNGPDACGE